MATPHPGVIPGPVVPPCVCVACGRELLSRLAARHAYRDVFGVLHADPGAMAARQDIYVCAWCVEEAGGELPHVGRDRPAGAPDA